MGWAISGGVLGIILMFGAYRWLMGWSTARSGGVSVPTIGSRPRRLAGVPEEAPAGARMPPAMEVLRYGDAALVVEPEPAAEASVEPAAPEPEAVAEAAQPAPAPVEPAPAAAPDEPAVEAVAAGAASGVVIAAVNQGSDDQGEFVLITNGGPNPVALEGWKLTDDGEKHTYDFPAITLQPDTSVRVHMWRGADTATDLFVGRRNRWWNNTGDTASLYDAAGGLVHTFTMDEIE